MGSWFLSISASLFLASTSLHGQTAAEPRPEDEVPAGRDGGVRAGTLAGSWWGAGPTGRFDAAHEVFDVLVERFPDSGSPYHEKGFAYEVQGEVDRAREMYEKALRIGLEQDEQDFMVHRYRTALERVRASGG